jgi:hypothetical protein
MNSRTIKNTYVEPNARVIGALFAEEIVINSPLPGLLTDEDRKLIPTLPYCAVKTGWTLVVNKRQRRNGGWIGSN